MAHPLLQFCTTCKQHEFITMCCVKGMSQRSVSMKTGMARSTVRDHLAAVQRKAARQGYSPDNDWHHPVPDWHKIKGVSTF